MVLENHNNPDMDCPRGIFMGFLVFLGAWLLLISVNVWK